MILILLKNQILILIELNVNPVKNLKETMNYVGYVLENGKNVKMNNVLCFLKEKMMY